MNQPNLSSQSHLGEPGSNGNVASTNGTGNLAHPLVWEPIEWPGVHQSDANLTGNNNGTHNPNLALPLEGEAASAAKLGVQGLAATLSWGERIRNRDAMQSHTRTLLDAQEKGAANGNPTKDPAHSAPNNPPVVAQEAEGKAEEQTPTLLSAEEIKQLRKDLRRRNDDLADDLVPRNWSDTASVHAEKRQKAAADFKADIRARLKADEQLKAAQQAKEAARQETEAARAKAEEHRQEVLAEIEATRVLRAQEQAEQAHIEAAKDDLYQKLMSKARIAHGGVRLDKAPDLLKRLEQEARDKVKQEFPEPVVAAVTPKAPETPQATGENSLQAARELEFDPELDGSLKEWLATPPIFRQAHRDKVAVRRALEQEATALWDAVNEVNYNNLPAEADYRGMVAAAAKVSRAAIRASNLSEPEKVQKLKEIDKEVRAQRYVYDLYKSVPAPLEADKGTAASTTPAKPADAATPAPAVKAEATPAQPALTIEQQVEQVEQQLEEAIAKAHEAFMSGNTRNVNGLLQALEDIERIKQELKNLSQWSDDDEKAFDDWLAEELPDYKGTSPSSPATNATSAKPTPAPSSPAAPAPSSPSPAPVLAASPAPSSATAATAPMSKAQFDKDLLRLKMAARKADRKGKTDERNDLLRQGKALIEEYEGLHVASVEEADKKFRELPTLRERARNTWSILRDGPRDERRKKAGTLALVAAVGAAGLLAALAVKDGGEHRSSTALAAATTTTAPKPTTTVSPEKPKRPGSEVAVKNGDGYTQDITRYALKYGKQVTPERAKTIYTALRSRFGDNIIVGVPSYTMPNGDLGLANTGTGNWGPGVEEVMNTMLGIS